MSNTKHIISFSGGKDSTAMLLMMLERGMQVDEVRFFDTGWEFPAMYEHIEQVEQYTGVKITVLHPVIPLIDEMLHRPVIARNGEQKGRVHQHGYGWPSPMRRWCTGTKNWILYGGVPKDAIWYIGFAADEKARAKRLSQKKDGRIRQFPLVDWGMVESDALKYCLERGFNWGGLYEHFARVSCFCCPLQRIGELRALRKHYPDLWQKMMGWDAEMIPPRPYGARWNLPDLEARFAREEAMDDAQYKITA